MNPSNSVKIFTNAESAKASGLKYHVATTWEIHSTDSLEDATEDLEEAKRTCPTAELVELADLLPQ